VKRFSAFSLIELLVVMAIVVILMAAAVPALNSVLEGGRLTQATTLIVNQFTLAKQNATAENKNITLRVIRKDTSSPYDRIQLVRLDSAGNATPMLRVATLPTQTAIASDPNLSSIMGIAESAAAPTKDPSIPGLETSYRYVQFTFRPRGSLELNIQANWFATVVFARHASDSSPPANFATIQIDPVNGGVQVYRP
jgi:uncharacterized protein (TIGR02596 family)